MEAKQETLLEVPDYVHDILYDMGGIKGAWLHDLVDEAIRKDGRVPSEDEWSQMVDAVTDEMADLELGEKYPNADVVLQNLFIP